MRFGFDLVGVRLRLGCGRPIKTVNEGKKKMAVSLRCLSVISEFEVLQVMESYCGVEIAYIKDLYVNEDYIIDNLVENLSKYSKIGARLFGEMFMAVAYCPLIKLEIITNNFSDYSNRNRPIC